MGKVDRLDVWESDCDNSYTIFLAKGGKEQSYFYGSINHKENRFYYRAICEDLLIDESTLHFKLGDATFRNDTLIKEGVKGEHNLELELLLPNYVEGNWNEESSINVLKVFKKLSFSNFEECFFRKTK